MIEEVKKEINKKVNDYFWEQGCKNEEAFTKIKKIYNGVLDKYKDNPLNGVFANVNDDALLRDNGNLCAENKELMKFKNAWEEVKQQMGDGTFPISYNTIQELEKKHRIGVE